MEKENRFKTIANFIDSQGKGYYVTSYVVASTASGIEYRDGSGEVLVGEDGIPLKSVNPEDNILAAVTITGSVKHSYGKNARDRDIKGIREIASKHARSADGRHERWKSIKRELG